MSGTVEEPGEERNREDMDLTATLGLTDKEAESRFIDWYEEICKERIAMSETENEYKTQIQEFQDSEKSYQKRINELETSSTEVFKAFEEVQSEVKMLRTKYEPPVTSTAVNANEMYVESYEKVVKENAKLKEVHEGSKKRMLELEADVKTLKEYVKKLESDVDVHEQDVQDKEQIKVLEDEVKTLRNYVKDFESGREMKTIKQRLGNQTRNLVVITHSERLENIEQENRRLKYELERSEHERKSLTTQLQLVQAKTQTLDNRKPPTGVNSKKQTHVTTSKSPKIVSNKLYINKQCVPTFLPKIDGRSSGLSTGTQDAGESSSASPEASSRSGLVFGLGYSDMHYKRSSMSSESSTTSSAYRSLYKYML